MPANTPTAKNFFLNSDPTLRTRYALAMTNQAQVGTAFKRDESLFSAVVQPTLSNHHKAVVYVLKSFLGDGARTNESIALRLARWAMEEAVNGDTPRITLTMTNGVLDPVTDEQIEEAVAAQFLDDSLVKDLIDQGIISVVIR